MRIPSSHAEDQSGGAQTRDCTIRLLLHDALLPALRRTLGIPTDLLYVHETAPL